MQSSRAEACAKFRSCYRLAGLAASNTRVVSTALRRLSYRLLHPVRAIRATWYAHLVASRLSQLGEGITLAPCAFEELQELASGFHQRVGQRFNMPCIIDGSASDVIMLQTSQNMRRILYMVSTCVGTGSGGDVFKGITFPIDWPGEAIREVAVKMAPSPKCLSEEPLHSPRAHRLIREAALLRELHADGVMPGVQTPAWNIFTVEDSTNWLTCYAGELYRGDARSFVPRTRLCSKEMPVRLREMSRLAEGLAHIHGKGFLHGDLDLRNVFRDEGGFVIGDFGISRKAPEGAEGRIKMRREVRDLARAISALLAPVDELCQWSACSMPDRLAGLGVPKEQCAVMGEALSNEDESLPLASEFYEVWREL